MADWDDFEVRVQTNDQNMVNMTDIQKEFRQQVSDYIVAASEGQKAFVAVQKRILDEIWEFLCDNFFQMTMEGQNGHCDVRFVPHGTRFWKDNSKVQGYTENPRELDDDYNPSGLYIDIFIFESKHIGDLEKRLVGYASVLAHEALHAFLALNTCNCDSCIMVNIAGEGATGHGPTWQRLAKRLEAILRTCFGPGINFLRQNGLREEVAAGLNIDNIPFEEYGISREEVERKVKV